MSVVIPGHLSTTPDLLRALDIVRRNQGSFGAGAIPRELLDVLEWFVDPPCVLVLPPPGVSLGCVCFGDAFHFWGVVVEPSVPKTVGELRYDVGLRPGAERVHLDLYLKNEVPLHPPMSMKPHLKRVYEAMVRVGIPTLELEAGLEAGPTFWAYAGVEFAYGRPLLDHLELLAAELAGSATPPAFDTPEDVRVAFPGHTATIREAYERSEQLSPFPLLWVTPGQLSHNVSQLGIPVDDPLALGEAILFAIAPWNGRVDLRSLGVSDARFRAFLGL